MFVFPCFTGMGRLVVAAALAVAMVTSLAPSAAAKKAKPSPDPRPPVLPSQYTLTGTIVMPGAGVTEPFRSFYDGVSNQQVRVCAGAVELSGVAGRCP